MTTIKFVGDLRKWIREEATPVQAIYNAEVDLQAPDDVPHLPSFPSLKSSLYRHRRTTIHVLPQTRADAHLEGQFTTARDGRRFLLCEDGQEDKIIIFPTDEQMRCLAEADTLYMDGTFSCCPHLWNQLYTVHARIGYSMYPLVFALLPNRQQTTYTRMFTLLKTEVQQMFNRPHAPATHPNLYRFVDLIQGIQKSEGAKLEHINFGAAPQPRKKVYRESEGRFLRLKEKLTRDQKTSIEFLDAVGHLLKLD
ncbi:uncharacterized protein [Haliotis asinina]|uniref:uncharacterized protein n=1 Tax=Haliotis asinina TaxID=109174 RepID=UPI003531F510